MKESGLLCQIEWYRDNKNLLPSQAFPEAVFVLRKNNIVKQKDLFWEENGLECGSPIHAGLIL